MSQLRLYRQLVGRLMNFNPVGLSREAFMVKIFVAHHYFLGVRPYILFCPKLAFTNRVVRIGEDDDIYSKKEIDEAIVIRTKNSADGGIVTGKKNAIAFFNGDCPIIVLIDQRYETGFICEPKIAVLHAGFRTLIRKNKDEPNIIESAMKHFVPKDTKAFVGYGIGPCCWVPGYEDKPEILNSSKSRYSGLLANSISKTTDKSPLGPGYVSVDLYKLAKGLLMEAGISENKILVNNQCTCCAEDDNGKPIFWSHTRFKAGKQEIDGRNMAVAFLVKN